MTKIIQFVAGPGAGKSTIAYSLFAWMKEHHYNVTFVPEYATECVWKNDLLVMDDQIVLFGEQNHRLYRLLGQADWIVSDTSIVLGMYYVDYVLKKYNDLVTYGDRDDVVWALKNLINCTYNLYDNHLFWVERGERKFVQEGRIHNEEQSKQIDMDLKQMLDKYLFSYTIVNNLDGVLKELKL